MSPICTGIAIITKKNWELCFFLFALASFSYFCSFFTVLLLPSSEASPETLLERQQLVEEDESETCFKGVQDLKAVYLRGERRSHVADNGGEGRRAGRILEGEEEKMEERASESRIVDIGESKGGKLWVC